MTSTKTRYIPQKADGKQSLNALDVLSVKRRRGPDYRGYSDEMRQIHALPLTQEEYKIMQNAAAERHGL